MTEIDVVENDSPKLTEAQTAAIERFASLKVGAAFMEQGMGKSRVAVELANSRADRIDAVLWVTPFSVKKTAEAEAKKWGLKVPARYVGYQTLSQSDAAYVETVEWVKSQRVMVIADESSFIKNGWSKRHIRMVEIRRHADYALALNGTPLTRDLWDLKRQMDWLSPKIVPYSNRQFQDMYFIKHEFRKYGDPDYRVWFTAATSNVKHLRSIIAPYVLEARLNLDVEVEEHASLHMLSSKQMEHYEDVRDDFFVTAETGNSDLEFYKLLGALTRISALDPERHASIASEVSGRCIVFCQFIEELRGIAKNLEQEPFIVTGETPAGERDRILDEFRRSARPLFMTYGVGSFGLNLQEASTLHFASKGFDYGLVEQARSRIRRLGQKDTITFVHHYSNAGIEDFIANNLTKKEVLAKLVRREFTAENL